MNTKIDKLVKTEFIVMKKDAMEVNQQAKELRKKLGNDEPLVSLVNKDKSNLLHTSKEYKEIKENELQVDISKEPLPYDNPPKQSQFDPQMPDVVRKLGNLVDQHKFSNSRYDKKLFIFK